jgi:hypothetical protein
MYIPKLKSKRVWMSTGQVLPCATMVSALCCQRMEFVDSSAMVCVISTMLIARIL